MNLHEAYNPSNRETFLTPNQSNKCFYKNSVTSNRLYKKALANPHSDLTTKIKTTINRLHLNIYIF